ALAIDRQSAVAGLDERRLELLEGDCVGHGDHVAARDRDLAGGLVAEVEQVAEHDPLLQAQVARFGALLLGLVDRIPDLVAQGWLAIAAEDKGPTPPPQAGAAVIVMASRHQRTS